MSVTDSNGDKVDNVLENVSQKASKYGQIHVFSLKPQAINLTQVTFLTLTDIFNIPLIIT